MEIEELRRRFDPALKEITESCCITEDFVDKDQFRVYLATVWGNAVLEPEKSGIDESDLSDLHDYLNEESAKLLGTGETITEIYQYLVSKPGEDALTRLNVAGQHRDFIHYFARLILGANPLQNVNITETGTQYE